MANEYLDYAGLQRYTAGLKLRMDARYGAPLVAATAAAMTDTDRVYVYTGSETGYSTGHWYYYDGDSWEDGGVYQSSGVQTDTTLSIAGEAADAKATGDAVAHLERTVCIPTVKWNLKKSISNTGVISASNYTALTDIIPCSGGDELINTTPAKDANNVSFVMYICTYSTTSAPNDTFVERIGFMSARDQVLGANITGVRFQLGRASASGVQIAESDINYFGMRYFLKPASTDDAAALQQEIDAQKIPPLQFLYTSLGSNTGFWNDDGTLTNNLSHSDALRVASGGVCYISALANQSIQGAFLDARKKWIAPIRWYADFSDTADYAIGDRVYYASAVYEFTAAHTAGAWIGTDATEVVGEDRDVSPYTYRTADGNQTATNYVKMYEIAVPDGAEFVSLNLSTTTANAYRLFLSSKPVFALNTDYAKANGICSIGNLVNYNDYGNGHQNRNMCVIGPSGVMIDRWWSSKISQYLVGWQEYLAPFYKTLQSYGFSGGSMGDVDPDHISIYDGIITAHVDLTGYDEFIIFSTKNDIILSGVGEWGDYDAPSTTPDNEKTYMGGLRALVDYIYTQNSQAVIYICTLQYTGTYHQLDSASYAIIRPLVDEINEKIREMGLKLGIPVLDIAADAGFNHYTYFDPDAESIAEGDGTVGFTYDGTHYNQKGAAVLGLYIRKRVLGF